MPIADAASPLSIRSRIERLRLIGFPLAAAPVRFIVLMALAFPLTANAQLLDRDLWTTDGRVDAITTSAGRIYIGGSFTRVSPMVGGAALLDGTTGAPIEVYGRVNGQVLAAVGDGSGGWFLGGGFTSVRGVTRNNLAHVDASGNLTSWNPGANGVVRSLAYDGAVFVGGEFSTLGGQPRAYIGAVDAGAGGATGWNPGSNGTVYSMVVNGANLLVGGNYSIIGGQARGCIAALGIATGVPTSWNPIANNVVTTMAFRGNTLYAGGYFTEFGGQPRSYLAAVDLTSGALGSWNPGADQPVFALRTTQRLVPPGTITVFAGGYFANIGGQARNYLAALDGVTGAATAWNPNADDAVNAIAVRASNVTGEATTIYVGGDFQNVAGQPRHHLAALTPAGAATAWDPSPDEAVTSLALGTGTVHVGGSFNAIGGQPRNRIAALDAASGAVTAWNPNANGDVRALAFFGSTLFVGGVFSNIGGQARYSIAALDTITGAATAWDGGAVDPPRPFAEVNAIAVRAGVVYAGGRFSIIGGPNAFRNNIAGLDAVTGAPTNFNANADGVVSALATTQRITFPNLVTVYAAGEFFAIGGQPRFQIAALDGETGAATTFNPSADYPVRSLAVRTSNITGAATTIYAGGEFLNIGGQPRRQIAALTPAGAATSWNPDAAGSVTALAFKSTGIVAGGFFSTIGGATRSSLAEIDLGTGLATAWNPTPNGQVTAVASAGGLIYFGGSFAKVLGEARPKFAAVTDQTVAVEAPVAIPPGLSLSAAPNPSRSGVALTLTLAEPGDAELGVYDLAGRLVRRVHRGPLAAGVARLNWDGRDDRGRALTAGIYFARAHAGTQGASLKLLRLE